jgi:hypothetical protein
MTDIYSAEIVITADRNEEIPREIWEPLFWDMRFEPRDGQTIFLDPSLTLEVSPKGEVKQSVKGLRYCSTHDIEDRLSEGYAALADASRKAIELAGSDRSAVYAEHLLRIAFDRSDLWIGHIKSGYIAGAAQGYSYRGYGYSGKALPSPKPRRNL